MKKIIFVVILLLCLSACAKTKFSVLDKVLNFELEINEDELSGSAVNEQDLEK
jgi:hypothetical protein